MRLLILWITTLLGLTTCQGCPNVTKTIETTTKAFLMLRQVVLCLGIAELYFDLDSVRSQALERARHDLAKANDLKKHAFLSNRSDPNQERRTFLNHRLILVGKNSEFLSLKLDNSLKSPPQLSPSRMAYLRGQRKGLALNQIREVNLPYEFLTTIQHLDSLTYRLLEMSKEPCNKEKW